MTNSTPVVIASNQSAISVNATALPLPTGAATEVTLNAINSKTPSLGQNTMSASQPVTIASNQSAVPVNVVSGGGASTQLIRATASGTGYAQNDLLEFNGLTWRNIANPTTITTLVSPPSVNTVFPIQGEIINTSKEWKVTATTGTPAAATGDIVHQVLRRNGNNILTSWFNITSSQLFTIAPAIANLTENTNKGADLLNGQNGRQEWSMYTNNNVGGFSNTSIYTGGQLITSIGNVSTPSQSTFTVPVGKTLRIISMAFTSTMGSITTGYQIGTGMAIVYNNGAAPSVNSPQAIACVGLSGYIPQNSGASNGLMLGGSNSHSGCDIPSGSFVSLYQWASNVTLQGFTLHVKGYLYNN